MNDDLDQWSMCGGGSGARPCTGASLTQDLDFTLARVTADHRSSQQIFEKILHNMLTPSCP